MSKRLRGLVAALVGLTALAAVGLALAALFGAQSGILVGQQVSSTATPVLDQSIWTRRGWPTPQVMATVPCPSCPPGFVMPPTQTPVTPVTTPPPPPQWPPPTPEYTPTGTPPTGTPRPGEIQPTVIYPTRTPLPISGVIDLAPELATEDKEMLIVQHCNGAYVVLLLKPMVASEWPLCPGDVIISLLPPMSIPHGKPPKPSQPPPETPVPSLPPVPTMVPGLTMPTASPPESYPAGQ